MFDFNALPPPFDHRPMTAADLNAVVAIDQEVKPSPWSRASFAAELHNTFSRLRVVTVSGEVAGYIVTWLVAGELQVHTLAVDAALRGQGLGELLLLEALWAALAAGAVAATLEVRPSNKPAIELYRKYHFHMVGERPRYYRDNHEGALLMDLVIEPAAFRVLLEARAARLAEKLAAAARLRGAAATEEDF